MLEKIERSLDEVGEDLSREPAAEASSKSPKATKKVKKVAKKVVKKKAKGKAKVEASDDGKISLSELASEAGITAAAARRKLRAADLSREGRWSWEDGSKAYKEARKALGLD
jgi:hypothetical protein